MKTFFKIATVLIITSLLGACSIHQPQTKSEKIVKLNRLEICDLRLLGSGKTYWASMQGSNKIILSSDGAVQCRFIN